jgi:hypothetical protein
MFNNSNVTIDSIPIDTEEEAEKVAKDGLRLYKADSYEVISIEE